MCSSALLNAQTNVGLTMNKATSVVPPKVREDAAASAHQMAKEEKELEQVLFSLDLATSTGAIPDVAAKMRGQMERDLELCMKRRERRVRKKKKSQECIESLWEYESMEWDHGPCELLFKVRQPWFNAPDYSRRLIRGTGWVANKVSGFQTQIWRHNWLASRKCTASATTSAEAEVVRV